MTSTRVALETELAPFVEAAQAIEGWQLDYAPQPLDPGPPWGCEARARTLVGEASSTLDLGTGGGGGGGEVLDRLVPGAALWWRQAQYSYDSSVQRYVNEQVAPKKSQEPS